MNQRTTNLSGLPTPCVHGVGGERPGVRAVTTAPRGSSRISVCWAEILPQRLHIVSRFFTVGLIVLIAIIGGCKKKKVDDELIPLATLEEQMHSPDPEIRGGAVRQLQWMTENPSAAVPLLIKATSDKDAAVRYEAVHGLGNFGAAAAEAIPNLTAALKDGDADIRACAAHTLGTMGSKGATAMNALQAASRDANETVRNEANWAIKTLNQVLEYNRLHPQPPKG